METDPAVLVGYGQRALDVLTEAPDREQRRTRRPYPIDNSLSFAIANAEEPLHSAQRLA
jgi:hypothetical protein